jgi:hypothetical protein
MFVIPFSLEFVKDGTCEELREQAMILSDDNFNLIEIIKVSMKEYEGEEE